MDDLYIFVHIPKTAGESFKQNIEASLPKECFLRTSFNYYERYYDIKENRKKFYEGKESFTAYLNSLTEEEKRKIRCIGGHDSYFGIHEPFKRPAKYFAFFREPVARTISLYNYERMAWERYSQMKEELTILKERFLQRMKEHFLIEGQVPSFEEWLAAVYDQKIPFYFSMKRYLNHLGFEGLKEFHFAGTTETYDEDARFIFQELGVKKGKAMHNASKAYVSLDKLEKRVVDKIREVNQADIALYEDALKFRAFRIKTTDERFVPWSNDLCTGYEHLHRYALAQKYAAGKRVLDLACGEGYGSALLAQTALHVTGIDISAAAVEYARARYKMGNLEFKTADMTALPLSDPYDLIVCFEALEHIENQEGLLQEVQRLLKRDGVLLISTPNKPVYSENRNPFHKKELDLEEFRTLLSRHFSYVEVYGQKTYASSTIFPLAAAPGAIQEYRVNNFALTQESEHLPRFFLAVASNRQQAPMGSTSLTEIGRTGFAKWETRKKKQTLWEKLKKLIWHFCKWRNVGNRDPI